MSTPQLSEQQFEELLATLCDKITSECRAGAKFGNSKLFERRVREVLNNLVSKFGLAVNFDPHPYIFPDIALGKFGVEVKFAEKDTWRSVANSVFESTRDANVEHIYVVFGKMAGWIRFGSGPVRPGEERESRTVSGYARFVIGGKNSLRKTRHNLNKILSVLFQ